MFMFVKRDIWKCDGIQLSLLFIVYSDEKILYWIGLVRPGVRLQSVFHGFGVNTNWESIQ